jgi:hypothetical protein
MAKLNKGDFCRALCTAPARYIVNGMCMYVSCQDNSLDVTQVYPSMEAEEDSGLPYPSDDAIEGAYQALIYIAGRNHAFRVPSNTPPNGVVA